MPGRPLIAALLVCAVLALWPGTRGPLAGFAWSLPALIVLGDWLLLRGPLRARPAETRTDPAASLLPGVYSLLLLAPTLGVWLWCTLLAQLEVPYLDPAAPLMQALRLTEATVASTAPLLLSAGLAGRLVGGPAASSVAGASLGAAFGALIGQAILGATLSRLGAGDLRGAAIGGALCSWTGLFALLGAALGMARLPRAARRGRGAWLLAALGALAAAWGGTAPLGLVLRSLPDPASAIAVPTGEPGGGMALQAVDPSRRSLEAALDARRYPRLRDPLWACPGPGAPPWTRRVRSSALVAHDAREPSSAIFADAQTLFLHGVYRLGLLGRAPRLPGLLGERLSWPSASFFLDLPPETSAVFYLGPEGLRPVREGTAGCALVVSGSVPIQALFSTAQTLSRRGGPCAAGLGLLVPEDPGQAPQDAPPGEAVPAWARALAEQRVCPREPSGA